MACLRRSHFAHRLGLQVYSLFGNNFVKTILRLARECDQLGRVDKFDQAEPGWPYVFLSLTAGLARQSVCVIDRLVRAEPEVEH